VGGVVADQRQRLGIAVGEDRDLGAVRKSSGEVSELAIDTDCERGLGQPGADSRSGVAPRGAIGQLQRRPIREPDSDLLSGRLDPAMLPTARRATYPR
jgi:hypothetical protein